jgi:hypothetical protein
MTNRSLRRPHDQATGMPTLVPALRRAEHAMRAFTVVYLPLAGGANAPCGAAMGGSSCVRAVAWKWHAAQAWAASHSASLRSTRAR